MTKKSQNFERLEREQRQGQLRIITTIGIVLLAVVAFAVFQGLRGSAPKDLNLTGQPTLGNLESKVELVIFEDFKCPVCKQFDGTIFPKIEEKYINTNKIRYGFRNFMVISPQADSRTAAIAGECVYNQKKELFFPFSHLMYRAQGDESTEWATRDRILEVASYVPDLNKDELGKCIDEKRYEKEVENDQATGTSAGVSGTPSLFINGVKVENPFDEAALFKAIDEALANSTASK